MRLDEQIRPSGFVTATVRNLDDEIIQIVRGKNLVTDAGEALFAAFMNDEAPDAISHCAVGTDNTPPAEGDATLGAEIGRLAVTDQSRAAATITYETFFGIADHNGAWEEEGLLNAGAGGDLVVHTLFAATINKNITNTVTVSHELIVAGA